MRAGSVTVDVCDGGCGGLWFDQFELQKVDEPHETAGEILLHVHQSHGVAVDYTRRRHCPKCPALVMMRRYFSPQRLVEVDECPGCGGLWLDAQELGRIRRELGATSGTPPPAQRLLARLTCRYTITAARK